MDAPIESIPDDALTQLPLFPLPNVVFFPGMLLPLNVFEPRYLELMTHCLDGHRVVAIPQAMHCQYLITGEHALGATDSAIREVNCATLRNLYNFQHADSSVQQQHASAGAAAGLHRGELELKLRLTALLF